MDRLIPTIPIDLELGMSTCLAGGVFFSASASASASGMWLLVLFRVTVRYGVLPICGYGWFYETFRVTCEFDDLARGRQDANCLDHDAGDGWA